MDLNLKGKVAIVTGGSRGIGAAIVEKLSCEGARVFFTYKSSAEKAEEVAKRSGAVGVRCAQGDAAAIGAAVDAVFGECGRVDILVNNAGITRDCLMLTMPESSWDDVLRVNASAAFEWTKCAARKMWLQKSGSVVFVSSVSALVGVAGQANYAASKAALCALARVAAAELGAKNVRVNAVCPGFVETDMIAKMPRDVLKAQREKIALGRFGKPGEIADLVAFLASDSASYITGQAIVADGGMICRA